MKGKRLRTDEIKAIGVVGAGLMGHGIAQIFVFKGFKVKLFDNDPKVPKSAPAKIRNNLQTLSELHLVESSEVAQALDHLQICTSLAEICTRVELIIEAVSENLDLKKTGTKARRGFYPWTDERIERVIHRRDEALLEVIEVIKGLNRENRQ
jgi:glycerol-3-phosphate dehydrogenase